MFCIVISKRLLCCISENELDEFYESGANNEQVYTNILLHFYYSSKGDFFEDNQLLRDAHTIAEIPTIIIHGRYDIILPPISAYRLYKKLPKSKLIIVEKAGHSWSDKPITRELLLAMQDIED